jgi:hypothetical protein
MVIRERRAFVVRSVATRTFATGDVHRPIDDIESNAAAGQFGNLAHVEKPGRKLIGGH